MRNRTILELGIAPTAQNFEINKVIYSDNMQNKGKTHQLLMGRGNKNVDPQAGIILNFCKKNRENGII